MSNADSFTLTDELIKKRQQAEEKRHHWLADLLSVSSTAQGERFLLELLKRCHFGTTPYEAEQAALHALGNTLYSDLLLVNRKIAENISYQIFLGEK